MERALIVQDELLPSQLLPTRQSTPEQRLLLAIVDEALHTLTLTHQVYEYQAQLLFRETLEWFAERVLIVPYTWPFIAQHLGVEPELGDKIIKHFS